MNTSSALIIFLVAVVFYTAAAHPAVFSALMLVALVSAVTWSLSA